MCGLQEMQSIKIKGTWWQFEVESSKRLTKDEQVFDII
jgi:hypothetical protein